MRLVRKVGNKRDGRKRGGLLQIHAKWIMSVLDYQLLVFSLIVEIIYFTPSLTLEDPNLIDKLELIARRVLGRLPFCTFSPIPILVGLEWEIWNSVYFLFLFFIFTLNNKIVILFCFQFMLYFERFIYKKKLFTVSYKKIEKSI